MKIRTDFVTNSSSSSYIIAFKGFPKIDEDVLEKYPFLRSYHKIVKNAIFGNESGSYETEATFTIDNIIDLEDYFLNNYYCDNLETLKEEENYIYNVYKDCIDKLKNGYDILVKKVGYDDYRIDLFRDIQSEDFIIMNRDEI